MFDLTDSVERLHHFTVHASAADRVATFGRRIGIAGNMPCLASFLDGAVNGGIATRQIAEFSVTRGSLR